MNTNATKSERGIIATLALIQFIHILDFMVMMPLGPQFIRVFSIDAQHFSYLIAAYTISAGIFGFLGSFFLDKLERKKALRVLLSGFILGTFFCALSPHYLLLLASRILTGAFGGILSSLVLSILGDTIPAHRRGRAMGVVMMSFSLASVFGVPFGLFLSNMLTWQAPFMLIVGVGVIVELLVARFIPIIDGHLAHEKGEDNTSAINYVISNHNPRSALLVTLAIMLGQFSIIPLVSTYMVTNVGFTEHNLTYIYILGGLAAMMISPISGRLGDRFGKFPIFAIFSTLILVPIFFLTNLGHQSMVFPLMVSTLLFISSSGRMVCGMALIVSSVGAKQRGGFMSINTAVQQLGAGVASFIGGSIVTQLPSGQLQHYNWVGYWAMAMAVTSIFLASRVKSVDHGPVPTEIGIAEAEAA